MKFDKYLRKLIPSASLVTYNSAFRTVIDAADAPLSRFVKEFRSLPPNHLRIRVGVGNRILTNQMIYFTSYKLWLYAFSAGWCDLNSTIVDIGCGCGRFAHHLQNFEFFGTRFEGRYLGIDVDTEALEWCRKHFDPSRFTFAESTDASKSYHKEAKSGGGYRIPLNDGSADYVFSTSLFTHLLQNELINYLRETARVLKPGRYASHSTFCLDYPPPTYGDRHTFSHIIGDAHVESLAVPEAAVAYTEKFLLGQALEAGLSEPRLMRGKSDWQTLLIVRKAPL